MSRQSQTNTFNDGMNKDLTPILTPNTVMTDCLNGTIVTYNGNEFALQNDLGNYKFSSSLNPGYVPVGVKEYANTLYIISYNPIDDKVEIGSFPSMKTINTSTTHNSDEKISGVIPVPKKNKEERITDGGKSYQYVDYTEYNQKHSELLLMSDLEEDFKLYPGDRYMGVCYSDNPSTSTDSKYISKVKDAMDKWQGVSTFVLTDDKKLYNIDKWFSWDIQSNATFADAFKYVSWDVPGYIVIRPNINVMDSFDAYITDSDKDASTIKLQSLWPSERYDDISSYLQTNVIFLYRKYQEADGWKIISCKNEKTKYGNLYTSIFSSFDYRGNEGDIIEIVPALKVTGDISKYGPGSDESIIGEDFLIMYDQFKVIVNTKVQEWDDSKIKLLWCRYNVSNYQFKDNNITFNIGLESQYNTSCLAYYKQPESEKWELLFKYDEVGNQIVKTINFNKNFKKGNEYYISFVFINTKDLESLNNDTSYKSVTEKYTVKKYEQFKIWTTYAVSAFSGYNSFYNISEKENGIEIKFETGITLDNAIEWYLNQSESISVEFTDVTCNTTHNIQKKANGSWLNSEWKDDYLYSKTLETEEFRDYYKSTIYTNTSTPTVNLPYGESDGIIWSGIECSINYINFKDKTEEKTVNFSFENNSWTSVYNQEKRYRITYDQQDNIVVNIPVYGNTNISGYVSKDDDDYMQINSVWVFKANKKSIVSGVKPNLNKGVTYKVDKNTITASRDNGKYYAKIDFDQPNKIWKVVYLKIGETEIYDTNNGFEYIWVFPKIDNFEGLRESSNEGNNSLMAGVALCWCSGRDHEWENKWFDANGNWSNRVFGSCYPDATGVNEGQFYNRNYLTIIAPNKIQTAMPVVIPYKYNPQIKQYQGDWSYALNVLCEYLKMCNSMIFVNGSKTETYYKPFLSKSENNIKDNITIINPEISISVNIGSKTYNIKKNKKDEFPIKLNITIYDRNIVPDNNNIPSYNFTVKKWTFKDEKQDWYNDYYTLFSDSNVKVDATSTDSLQFRLTDSDYKSFAVFSNMYLRNE